MNKKKKEENKNPNLPKGRGIFNVGNTPRKNLQTTNPIIASDGVSPTNEKGLTESFLGGIPILGDLVKELGKTETFKKKFAETDEKIKENLRKGEKKKWGFEANISVRPIINEIKKETTDITIEDDYFYGKKERKLTLAVKAPKEEVNLKIKYKTLIITSGGFEKKIELPDYYREVTKKQYREGILVLELTR